MFLLIICLWSFSTHLLSTLVLSVYLTVCEELSVRDAGVRLMTTLTLCPGNAPKASQVCLFYLNSSINRLYLQLRRWMSQSLQVPINFSYPTFKTHWDEELRPFWLMLMLWDFLFALQLFLHFYVGTAPSAGMEMDIIVEKTCTVKQVRKTWLLYLCCKTFRMCLCYIYVQLLKLLYCDCYF